MASEFDIDVTQVTRYAKHLDGMAGGGALPFTGIAAKYRDLTREKAKEIVPRGKTLALHDSIQNTPGEASRMGLSANWHVTAPHASPVEYGFVHWISGEVIGPQPYVRPALDFFRRDYVEELAKAAKQQGLTKSSTRSALASL